MKKLMINLCEFIFVVVAINVFRQEIATFFMHATNFIGNMFGVDTEHAMNYLYYVYYGGYTEGLIHALEELGHAYDINVVGLVNLLRQQDKVNIMLEQVNNMKIYSNGL